MTHTTGPTAPCTPTELVADDGARLTACAHGGHVTSWIPAGGAERLWLSPLARCGPGLALRGGVPVVFPQFAGRGPLPKHGVARDRAWTVRAATAGATARWAARLRDDDATRAVWPVGFELDIVAEAAGPSLTITLTVRNRPGAATPAPDWTFTAALHTYLAVADPRTRLDGLAGLPAEDNARPGPTAPVADDPLPALAPRDIAVRGVAPAAVRLVDSVLGDLTLRSEEFPDRVVWNPGADHGLSDMPVGGESGFVCIEPALLEPRTLRPGEEWRGRLMLSVEA